MQNDTSYQSLFLRQQILANGQALFPTIRSLDVIISYKRLPPHGVFCAYLVDISGRNNPSFNILHYGHEFQSRQAALDSLMQVVEILVAEQLQQFPPSPPPCLPLTQRNLAAATSKTMGHP